MRDPKRIDEILNLIKSIWISYPDLRLIQLLIGILPIQGPWHGDYFYMEDEELVKHLKTYLKNIKEES